MNRPGWQIALLVLLLCAGPGSIPGAFSAGAAERALSGTLVLEDAPTDREARPPASPSRREKNAAPCARTWGFPSPPPPTTRDTLWQRGVPLEKLMDNATPHTAKPGARRAMNTRDGVGAALEESSQPTDPLQMRMGKHIGVRGAFHRQTTPWRPPSDDLPRVGEELTLEDRQVMGAYADIKPDPGVTISAGPEYTVHNESTLEQSGTRHGEANGLGLGLRLQWDF